MSVSWADVARRRIAEGMAGAPADMPLAARIKALRSLRNGMFASTSWGAKVWAKARREYLVPYGYEPKTKAARHARGELPGEPALPLSPLEQQKAASESYAEKLKLSGAGGGIEPPKRGEA